MAASKLDMDTFDTLVNKLGADPMQPDIDGNTVLHQIVLGVIRDAEYDFVKQVIQKYSMRLTRNKENRTPLSIIRSYSQKAPALRGQPNFKNILKEYFESEIAEDEAFQDCDYNQKVHNLAINGSLEEFKAYMESITGDDKVMLQYQIIERRNPQGKCALMLAIENKKDDIYQYLIETFLDIEIEKRDI